MRLFQIGFLLLQMHLLNCTDDIKFLNDFFYNRNCTIRLNVCWNNGKIQLFLKENFNSKRPKQVAIFNNRTSNEKFFNYQTSDNFFVLDLRRGCSTSAKLLSVANDQQLYKYPLKYLLLLEKHNLQDFLNHFIFYKIFPVSEIFIASFQKNAINLYQPYKIIQDDDLILENYGRWSLKDGLTENYKMISTFKRRYNFQQKQINVACIVLQKDTLNHFDDFKYPRTDSFLKQVFPIIHTLLRYLNLSFNLRIVDKYGYFNKSTNQWNGAINELKTGQSDISGNSIYYTLQRYEVVDFLKKVGNLDTRFLIKKPSTSYVENIYFMTFTGSVWLAILVILFIFAPILYMTLNWECKYEKKLKQNKYSVSDVTLITLEAVCQQGTTTEPSCFAGKTITLILFCAFMFLYVSYSAYIVVLLQSTKKIHTLSELLDSRIEVGGMETNYMKLYFQAAKSRVLKDLYRKKIHPNQYFSLEEGMKKVQDGNFAFHVPLGEAYNYVLQKFTNYDICGLQELPGYINYEAYVAVPKKSPFKKFFMIGLLKIDENGLQRRTVDRIFIKPNCYSQGGNFQSVRLFDCYQVFVIWMIGTILAYIFLFIEIIVDKHFHKDLN